ncbi:MAG TPA: hydrogenase expression/formation protein HypE [Caulifigura sp.]|nr:hydrogenase expression/formation protein HypE [Caulifigura sp.]
MIGERITLAHGEGGWLSRQLIEQVITRPLGNPFLNPLGDAAILPTSPHRIAFTTDSYVVTPLFFPGGDIGRLAVFGTVNDLVVSGARPLWLSLSLILEEGLEITTLRKILQSISEAAALAQVQIAAGDTKVVPRGAADKLFINTAGIGELVDPVPTGPASIEAGDILIVSGPIGRHGIAILAARENLGLFPAPESDCGPLTSLVESLRASHIPVRAMRDATRGGVAAVLHEWANASGLTLTIDETQLPLSENVRGACELLGLDPVHIANEGTMLIAVPKQFADAALQTLRARPEGSHACVIGQAGPDQRTPVLIRRGFSPERPLDLPSGAMLPRIC